MLFAFVRNVYPSAAKIYGAFLVFLIMKASADNVAMIGGINLTGTAPAYGALVSSKGEFDSKQHPTKSTSSLSGSFENFFCRLKKKSKGTWSRLQLLFD